jgi:hypothetical protein
MEPDIQYHYTIEMDSQGQSIFTLADSTGTPIESHTVIHSNVCADNYFEGTVLDLYFGGTVLARLLRMLSQFTPSSGQAATVQPLIYCLSSGGSY